jgi:hypothetical protein
MGDWRYEIWDTWLGRPTSTGHVSVGLRGTARVPLPVIQGDVAVKLLRTRSVQ